MSRDERTPPYRVSRQFIDFPERKLTEAGVQKVVPDPATIEQHARRLIEQRLAKEELDRARDQLARKAAEHALPDDLDRRIRDLRAERRELSWDAALALIL